MRIAKKIASMLTAMVCAVSVFCSGIHPLTAYAVSASEQMQYGDYLYYQQIDEDEDGTYDYIIITDCDESVTEVDIPAEIDGLPVQIYQFAFAYCTSLASIEIPDSVTEIAYCAFRGCTSLESITIPDSVIYIRGYAFEDCTSLVSIDIPDSVTGFDIGVFSGCTSLASITIKNPECVINFEYDIPDTATIYGYTNSTAQAYAEKYNRNFVSLGEYTPAVQGDISGNNKIDLYDAIEICKSIMGMRTFTEEEKTIADYDGNGVVDLYDAIGIAKKLLEK